MKMHEKSYFSIFFSKKALYHYQIKPKQNEEELKNEVYGFYRGSAISH